MLLMGLTGGIASGKSFVTDCFFSHGIPVIDADLLAREAVEPGSAGLKALVGYFSETILTNEGELDRASLRQRIFNNDEDKAFVENTLHPMIRQLAQKRIDAAEVQGHHYLVYAIPLLVETGQVDRFNRIIVVDVPEAVQLKRLVQRDGGSLEDAEKILASQASRQERLAIADDVIDNSADRDQTREQVHRLHCLYLGL